MAETWIHHTLAHLHARRGNVERGRELAARVRSVLLENGQTQLHALMAELVGDVELMAGDPARAVEVLRDGVAVTATVREPDAMLSSFLARAAWLGGDRELARSAAEQGLTGGGWIRPFAELSLGRVLAAEGQLDDALATARRSVEFFEQTDFLTFHAWALEAMADVQSAAGRREDAATSLERAVGLHDRKGNTAAADRARSALEALRESSRPSAGLHSEA
jgi:ATP/maltotriose-dependent transcriptional regulator MalT